MTIETLSNEFNNILTRPLSIESYANQILFISAFFRENASDEIKNELSKLNRFALIADTQSKFLGSIDEAVKNDLRLKIDDANFRRESPKNLTINIKVNTINLDSQVDYLVKREKEIADEIREMNLDFSKIISWLNSNFDNAN